MENTAQQLANEMGVSITDLMCLAKSVANSLEQDKVGVEQMEKMSENDKVDLVEAYVCHANRKFKQFHTAYLTNNNVRQTVLETASEMLF